MCNIFQVCKISGDKQESSVVATPENKELITLNIFRVFFVDLSVKFWRFCKIAYSSIKTGNHKSPFDFIWLYFALHAQINECSFHTFHFLQTKHQANLLHQDRQANFENIKLVVKSLGFIIFFTKYMPQL